MMMGGGKEGRYNNGAYVLSCRTAYFKESRVRVNVVGAENQSLISVPN